jgi:hypothetical protein
MLPLVIGQDIQASVFFLGIAALFLGRLPGGLFGVLRSLPVRLTASARREFDRAQQERRVPAPEAVRLQPTPFARSVVSHNGNGHGHARSAEEVVT